MRAPVRLPPGSFCFRGIHDIPLYKEADQLGTALNPTSLRQTPFTPISRSSPAPPTDLTGAQAYLKQALSSSLVATTSPGPFPAPAGTAFMVSVDARQGVVKYSGDVPSPQVLQLVWRHITACRARFAAQDMALVAAPPKQTR